MQQALCALFVAGQQAAVTTAGVRFPKSVLRRPLDRPMTAAMLRVMLQDNTAGRTGRHAHLAHAAVMGLHTLCCGLPLVALALTALAGATSGVVYFSETVGALHALLHAHEVWILVLSGSLVIVGGIMEVLHRRLHRHGFPWLFAMSVGCFLVNATIIGLHRFFV